MALALSALALSKDISALHSLLSVQLFQDSEVAVPSFSPELALKMVPDVILQAVVVEQGVVHVKQEHDFWGGCDSVASLGDGGFAEERIFLP